MKYFNIFSKNSKSNLKGFLNYYFVIRDAGDDDGNNSNKNKNGRTMI